MWYVFYCIYNQTTDTEIANFHYVCECIHACVSFIHFRLHTRALYSTMTQLLASSYMNGWLCSVNVK